MCAVFFSSTFFFLRSVFCSLCMHKKKFRSLDYLHIGLHCEVSKVHSDGFVYSFFSLKFLKKRIYEKKKPSVTHKTATTHTESSRTSKQLFSKWAESFCLFILQMFFNARWGFSVNGLNKNVSFLLMNCRAQHAKKIQHHQTYTQILLKNHLSFLSNEHISTM